MVGEEKAKSQAHSLLGHARSLLSSPQNPAVLGSDDPPDEQPPGSWPDYAIQARFLLPIW